jgi:DNA primase
VTGFGGRALDDTPPKYLNSPQSPVFDKSDTLYGIHLAAQAIRHEDLAVITEGYMDVIIPHQYGFQNVVASMGIAITDKQVNKLKRLTKNLVLALDPDAAGEEAMLRCIDYENTLGAEVRVVIVPGGKDPDEIIREDPDIWSGLIEKAKPVIEFAIEKTVGKLDMNKAGDKSNAANSMLPVIARVRDDIRRDHYLTRLSKLTGIGYNRLEAVLKTHLNAPKGERPKSLITPVTLRPKTVSREDYCLTLLLQHPGLKTVNAGLLPDYFQDSENREIYTAWLDTDDAVSLRERLDPLVREKLEELESKKPFSGHLVEKFTECVLLLQKDYIQSQEVMKEEIFTLEVQVGGAGADLVRLKKEGVEPKHKLHEVFTQKAQVSRRARK